MPVIRHIQRLKTYRTTCDTSSDIEFAAGRVVMQSPAQISSPAMLQQTG
jgi:hypothetical protein